MYMIILKLLFVLVGILFVFKLLYVFLGVVVSIKRTKGALFVPTPRVRISCVLENIYLRKGQLVVDFGCGDGKDEPIFVYCLDT